MTAGPAEFTAVGGERRFAESASAEKDAMHLVTGVAIGFWVGIVLAQGASAETMQQALADAYGFNPEINTARAETRAVDEDVPIARSGYRPIISLFSTLTGATTDSPTAADKTTFDAALGLSVTQNIFTGFRVRNAIRQAKAGVLASRELLRNTVQNVLFDAAVAYADVVRDSAILVIRQRNVMFLEEQVSAANERFSVGENTRTDVSQTRARLATGRAAVSLAQANLATSRATYHQVIGHDPSDLHAKFSYARLLPLDLSQAITIGQSTHPLVLASIHQADAQAFVIKQIEGEKLPTLAVTGTVTHSESLDTDIDPNTFSVTGRLSIPLYQGGSVSGRIRQAKEQYGASKIAIDLARDQVRAAVVSSWALKEAAEAAILAAEEGVDAAGDALTGVEEEQRVGQRTTLDVLDAQRELLANQETLILARRDRVVSAFSLLSAMGLMTGDQLGLQVELYEPIEHYDAVKNRWSGSRTPDGR